MYTNCIDPLDAKYLLRVDNNLFYSKGACIHQRMIGLDLLSSNKPKALCSDTYTCTQCSLLIPCSVSTFTLVCVSKSYTQTQGIENSSKNVGKGLESRFPRIRTLISETRTLSCGLEDSVRDRE